MNKKVLQFNHRRGVIKEAAGAISRYNQDSIKNFKHNVNKNIYIIGGCSHENELQKSY